MFGGMFPSFPALRFRHRRWGQGLRGVWPTTIDGRLYGWGGLGMYMGAGSTGAMKSTVNGTSPEMPVVSHRDMGTVAPCSRFVPQFPGQRSIVSLTVKLSFGTTMKFAPAS